MKDQRKKLQVVERSTERIILGVSKRERIRNSYKRERTGARDILYTINRSKLKYAGHVARQSETRSKKVMEWVPWDQKRGRGRLVTRRRRERGVLHGQGRHKIGNIGEVLERSMPRNWSSVRQQHELVYYVWNK